MTTEGLQIDDVDGVRRITFDRADKKNALTVAMYAAMADAVDGADAAGSGALLFTANGTTFTAGNDLRDFLGSPPRDETAPVFRFMRAIVTTAVPIVAAVRGNAVGIGTTLLLHCDLVYAGTTARFRTPFVDLGVSAEFASSVTFPRTMGRARSAAALLLGEPISAEAALRDGLITEIVDDDALDGYAMGRARALATKPREALRATRKLLRDPDRAELLEVIRREAAIFTERLQSAEAQTAFAAFLAPKARA